MLQGISVNWNRSSWSLCWFVPPPSPLSAFQSPETDTLTSPRFMCCLTGMRPSPRGRRYIRWQWARFKVKHFDSASFILSHVLWVSSRIESEYFKRELPPPAPQNLTNIYAAHMSVNILTWRFCFCLEKRPFGVSNKGQSWAVSNWLPPPVSRMLLASQRGLSYSGEKWSS